MTDDEVLELITRRRRQIIVHSVIYYRFDDNLISDHTFDMWSKELVVLQQMYPEIASTAQFAEEFNDFTGATGFHLSNIPWGVEKAKYLLMLKNEKGYFKRVEDEK